MKRIIYSMSNDIEEIKFKAQSGRKIDGSKNKTIKDVQLLFLTLEMIVDDTNDYYKQIEHLFEDKGA